MSKIFIKSPGLFLNIAGKTPVRTPCKIDLKKVKPDVVLSELRRHGIVKYFLTGDEEFISKKESIKVKKNNDVQLVEILDEIKKNDNKLVSKIEEILNNFLKEGIKIDNKNEFRTEIETPIKKKRSKINEDVEDFIPEINVKNLKIKGSGTSEKVIKTDDNLKNNVEQLKNVMKRSTEK